MAPHSIIVLRLRDGPTAIDGEAVGVDSKSSYANGIQVVDFGPPLVDEQPWEEAYLMRAFPSLADRYRLEETFYGGDDWRLGLRESVMSCIESYHTMVLDVADEVVAALTRSVDTL